jgi:menaquinone-specific isochorismate synthase
VAEVAPGPGALVARTTRLDADVELLFPGAVLFEGPDLGLAGTQELVRLDLPTGAGRVSAAAEVVAEALGAMTVEDDVGRPGTGPVAFCALPFDDLAPATALIPTTVLGRAADGTRWLTTVGSPGERPDVVPIGAAAWPRGPSSYTVRPTRSPESWCDAVAEARDLVRAGALAKVVLAREVVVEGDSPFLAHELLARLRASYPAAFRFAIDGLVGASPELLVARTGERVRSHPMAGTAPRSADPSTDARLAASLLASTKDRVEHQITIDFVLDALLPFCSYLDAEAEPSVVAMANVQHLATLVQGRLSAPPASALSLAGALHPTPAVCGSPREEARAAITRLEGFDRGRYAGPVGWVDANGDGAFAVAIRSAELDGTRAVLRAGVGVVADSDPDAELAESRSKLAALLGALVSP